MIQVRCGRCRTEFTVPGPGRYPCPACGAVNELRAPESSQQPTSPFQPPVPSVPSTPRVQCPSCAFRFIVGEIEVATCPNCGAEVPVGGDREPA